MTDLMFEKREGIGVVTLNRPESLNAVTPVMAEELAELAIAINRDPQVRVVVICGAGERAFCAGSDIKQLPDYETPWDFRVRARRAAVDYPTFAPNLLVPVIAMIDGYCLGGGLEIALNCDMRVAAESAVFGAPEVSRGWLGAGAASQLLPRLVGYGRAFELIAGGETITAAEANEWGLLNRLTTRDDLEPVTFSLAERFAALPPIALQTAKHAIRMSMNTPLDVGRLIENDLTWGTFTTEDKQEGVRAFTEKRPPRFTGR